MTHQTALKTHNAQLALEAIRTRGVRVSGTGSRRRLQAGSRSSTASHSRGSPDGVGSGRSPTGGCGHGVVWTYVGP
jgi:uncharacterized protein involved in type VI secretion and phage assembly